MFSSMALNYKTESVIVVLIFCFIFIALPSFGSEDLYSKNFPKSQNSFGGIGLLITPTARFSDDGELTMGVSSELPYNRIYAKNQFFP